MRGSSDSRAAGQGDAAAPQEPDTPPEEPPETSHYFAGCRFNVAECTNTCPTAQSFAVEHPKRCPPDAGEGPVACFCMKQGS